MIEEGPFDSLASAIEAIEPRLFCFGSGAFGQHGHIIDENISPIDGFLINPSVNVASITCGACYTFALKGDGNVLGWGSNQNGQIGCSHQRQCLTPTRADVENAVQVSAGDRHTLFLLRDGTVRGCGCNFYAQLSVDTLEELQRQDKLVPVALSLPEKVKQVACGQYHSLLLYSSGDVAAVGRNIYGQLGVPMPEGVKTDVLETPVTIEGAFKSAVSSIKAGQNHSMSIDDTGRCYVWGYCRACGSRGAHVTRPKLLAFLAEGDATDADGEVPIECAAGGSSHSLFLARGRRLLFALGCNLDGQCGLGESVNFAAKPVPLDLGWAGGADLTGIDCAENYSCAVVSSGEMWMWGRNSGVLPAVANADAATVIASEAESPRVFSPRRVPVPFAVLSVACGNWHAAAVVNYREHRDVSHLPGGRSNRKSAAPQQVAVSTTAAPDGAWVDIVSSREEKPRPTSPQSPASKADPLVATSAAPNDLLAVEDLDNGSQEFGKSIAPTCLPPPSPASVAAAMRRTKSLNRFPAGGEGRQPMRLRRIQPSSVQLDSELVHVYRLAPGSGRLGTATYHAQASNVPPQLEQRRPWPAGRRQLPLAEAAAAAKPPLPAAPPPASVPPSRQPDADTTGAIRRRPASSSSGYAVASLGPPGVSLPVRQNRASLTRRSSAGRLPTRGESQA